MYRSTSRPLRPTRRQVATAGLAIGLLVSVAACSSSSKGGSTGSSTAPASGGGSTVAAGAPIQVMVEGTFAGSTNPAFNNFPQGPICLLIIKATQHT